MQMGIVMGIEICLEWIKVQITECPPFQINSKEEKEKSPRIARLFLPLKDTLTPFLMRLVQGSLAHAILPRSIRSQPGTNLLSHDHLLALSRQGIEKDPNRPSWL